MNFHIFNIDLKKIDFLISKKLMYIVLIIYKDNTVNINCFENDMLITLLNL